MNNGRKYKDYLDPKVLAKIGGLELRARLAVEGYFSGMHRSPQAGLSVEYADHRSYAQGDDIRHIDWKVYARTDKHYIKRYEQETNLNCMIVVDCSESMSYQSPDAVMSKRRYAACMAAALAYLALRQRDAVGLALFGDTITSFVPPSNNPVQWKTMVHELDIAGQAPGTSLPEVLEDLTERLKNRTLVILLSDLFGDVHRNLLGLKRLRYHKHELIVCNIWDPAELRFCFKGLTLFDGMESTGRVMTDPQALQSNYLAEVDRFLVALRKGCREMHVDLATFDTQASLDVGISAYLATRSAKIRHRTSRVLGAG